MHGVNCSRGKLQKISAKFENLIGSGRMSILLTDAEFAGALSVLLPTCALLATMYRKALGTKSISNRRSYATRAMVHQPLVVIGSVNADLAVQLDRLPSPGETLSASTLEFFPGWLSRTLTAAPLCVGAGI